ncbi:MAG: cell division protein FtsA, partial [Gammaproteobacteria bacterium]|nr:cell division protein FtsA [Gammaproteobacteria bacterium]
KIEGIVDLAEEIFHMPVRLGLPQHISGLADVVRNPIYATGVGLLLYGQKHRHARPAYARGVSVKSVWGRMKSWFQGNF